MLSVGAALTLGFLNCASHYEVVSECPDRAQFESDFQYNLSLTQDIAEQCKIKDVNRGELGITLRKVRKSEIQTGVVNE